MDGSKNQQARRKQGYWTRTFATGVVIVSPTVVAIKALSAARPMDEPQVAQNDELAAMPAAGMSVDEQNANAEVADLLNDQAATPVLNVLDAPVLPVATTQPSAGDLPPTPMGLSDTTEPTDSNDVVSKGLDNGRLILSMNRSRLLMTKSRLSPSSNGVPAISAGSGEVIGISPVSPNSILITAKKVGSTNLIIQDEQGRRQVIEVEVDNDLEGLRNQLKRLYSDGKLDVSEANGSIVLRGQVPSLGIAAKASQLAAPYGKVINLMEICGTQQIMLQVKFAEVSKSASNNLGINFGYTDGTSFVGSNIGAIAPFNVAGTDPFSLALGAPAVSSATQIFGNGKFGKSAFAYYLNALQQNNLMRTLAEPNVLAESGKSAEFLAGGAIPIPVSQGGGSGSSAAISVEYKEYGVKLNFTPVVLGDGQIKLLVAPEVSDLDYSTAVQFNGFVVPGLTTRKVSTTTTLKDGQTYAIAGLLNNSVTTNASSLPILGDLPILGALFRSVTYQRRESELVVMITPHLVDAMNPSQVTAAPGEHWRYPSEADLFLYGDLGGESKDKSGPRPLPANPPTFIGQHGYAPTPATNVLQP